MLDIKKIREEPERFRKGLEKKGEYGKINELLELDSKRRKIVTEVYNLRATRNRVSEAIGILKKEGKPVSDKIEEMRRIGTEIENLEIDVRNLDKSISDILKNLPNIPHDSVKVGKSSEDNVVLREWGNIPSFDFSPEDHLGIGRYLGILDFARASKISGSGFPMYVGKGAKLERALVNFMLDFHVSKHGYKEVFPPFLATRDATFGTGQLPKLEHDMYQVEMDDLFLIPTAEVPLTNIHRDEIIPEEALPIKYVAYSACFRREAGSYGRETRGLIRVHQFNKVELLRFTTSESSYENLEEILSEAEEILRALNLHYRVVELCTADLSFAAAKCYDLEVWAPATGEYLEVSSVSNFEDFQARRANIRFRRSKSGKVEYVHTLNGSGVATPRLMIALLETYQTDEKTVIVPEVLQPYTGFQVIKSSD